MEIPGDMWGSLRRREGDTNFKPTETEYVLPEKEVKKEREVKAV